MSELKNLGINFEFGPAKLKAAHGEACIYVLNNLVDLVLPKTPLRFVQPVHTNNE